MSYISPSILRGLSTLIGDNINYLTLVQYNSEQWYLALARHDFYFVKLDLSLFLDPPVPYHLIEACRLCSKQKTLI